MKEDIKLKDGEPEKKIIIILEENKKLNEVQIITYYKVGK